MRKNNVLLPQSVLGALIAVNLKNSLKQLADPYYLWKKSKLDCVGIRGPLPSPPPPRPCQLFLSVTPQLCCSLICRRSC